VSDAEKFVRARYPNASVLGPLKNGRYHPEGGYGILLSPVMSMTRGQGRTIIEAWADAANRLLERQPESRMSGRVIRYDEITKGRCGRCQKPINEVYLWCDECEDLVERITGTMSWKVLSLERPPKLLSAGQRGAKT
jgi:hypothetical protein